MKFLCVISGICLLFAATATPAQRMKSSYDPAFDLSKLKTFDFNTAPRAKGDLVEDNSLTDKRIKRALESQLTAKGYIRASDGTADLLIDYYTRTRTRTGTRDSNPAQQGYEWLGPLGGSHTETVLEGTFVFDFTDASTGRLVWRGQITEILDRVKPTEKINRAAAKLIKQFAADANRKKSK